MAKRIVLTGGGTGGHIFPLVAVVDHIRSYYGQQEDMEFLFLGPASQLERETMERYGIPQKKIISGKMRRYFSLLNFLDIFKLPLGLFQSFWHLFRFMPDVVFAKGGYASVPVVIAAKIYNIPVLIHESDALPGMANRFMGSLADRIAIYFDRARMFFPPSKTFQAGIPIKKESIDGNGDNAREFLQLPYKQKPVILFIGGSQGASAINEQVLELMDLLLAKYQVVHQTGKAHYETICQILKEKGIDIQYSDYRPLSFLGKEMKDILAMADVVVSRAGATTIAELAANKKPCILIPIAASANGHQRVNAYEVAKAGAAIVLEEDNFKRGMLLHNLEQILHNGSLYEKLSENIYKFHFPDATKSIAEELITLASQGS